MNTSETYPDSSAPKQVGRKPDYRVGAMNKATGLKANIGAAWKNDDNSISVVVNNFTSLHQDGNLLITIFPAK